ncbi:MAG: hypothetical protein ACE5HN_04485 [Nitrospiria bacterium]
MPEPDEKETTVSSSVKDVITEWLRLGRRVIARTSWRKDAIRGLKTLQSGGTSIVDRSFGEVDLFRLRSQLEKIDQDLFAAYQLLGKKCVDHWTKGRRLMEVERKRERRRIDLLAEEKKRILGQMLELKEAPDNEAPSIK